MNVQHPIDVTASWLAGWPLPPLAADADKSERGSVFVLAGSREVPGAALLATEAAFRTGAGKVTVMTAKSVSTSVALSVPEARVVPYAETARGAFARRAVNEAALLAADASCVLLGPGMKNASVFPVLIAAIRQRNPRAVLLLDAAALRALPDPKVRRRAGDGPVVATPHLGEMADLRGVDKAAIEADPQQWAMDLCEAFDVIVALKGANTWIVEPGGGTWLHSNANTALAVSGSGDVLAGIIAGLVVRGAPAAQAAVWGVALHAMAGDRLSAKYGATGLLPREIPREIPALMNL